jgi:hypothetical protein
MAKAELQSRGDYRRGSQVSVMRPFTTFPTSFLFPCLSVHHTGPEYDGGVQSNVLVEAVRATYKIGKVIDSFPRLNEL